MAPLDQPKSTEIGFKKTDIDAMDKKTISTHEFSEYEDRYQVFAMIAFGFLIIGFIFPTRSRINE